MEGIFHANKGDVLMAMAIEQRLGSEYHVLIDKRSVNSFRLQRGMSYLSSYLPGVKKHIEPFLRSNLPIHYRQMIGMLNAAEIDGILECSGFQYSDQWVSLLPIIRMRLSFYTRMKQHGKKIIFLPQAFGPFRKEKLRHAFLPVLEIADLVIPRDKVSFQYLQQLDSGFSSIKLYPDMTVLVKAMPQHSDKWSDRVCFIPNQRVMEHSN
ncbi:polysaccharide pyruvyl transferase family protein [candidate division CSSED10-310 bacterium]|uniref:Polysaccharide pyruvyl transferase family protein n=1 Tax=candidate division CSSED10-310 bacterium TaxID=2855610 RepID=A0ABV6Z6U2_UNCC1